MDKRTLLAVILSLVVLLGWSYFFTPKPDPQKPVPVPSVQDASPLKPEAPAKPETVTPEAQIPVEYIAPAGAEVSDVVVETDLFKAVFSTEGAVIKHWELKTYKDKNNMPVVLLREPGIVPPLGIVFEGPDKNLSQKLIYTVNTKTLSLSERGDTQGELIFSYDNQGMSIKKRLIFHNNDYKVDISVETANTPSYMLPVGTNFGVYDKEQSEHKGPVILIDADREEFDEKLKSPKYFPGKINWIAQEDKYFAAAIIPVTPVEGANVWKEKDSAEIALKLKPQKNEFIFYAGPKEYDRLKRLNAGLEHIIDFGWFSIVAMPLFWVLKFFYTYLGNYGWAIIILTIVTRIPFIPIMHKSQKSMKKLQTIQPMMAELKEKYKKDPQKMQQETMALYKKYKVNPIGGCLPMLLQIPVFIALYNVLLRAIELRGAPFVLWITDLSIKDPYYVLPIVMGLTMVIQQKMTPSAMEPTQAKIMMLMPIIFTFMFLSFASGLVMYWLVNNVLGIAQQFYSNKKAAAEGT
ncbi:MAG: membrane protein insertase YidC [Nitrospirae bacterium]|nr:membrane protein insertase YidC [Nitrospirota bacterium]